MIFLLGLWGTWLAFDRRGYKSACAVIGAPISILKPLKGLEFHLEENLERFFHLTYPRFELLFCVADENDPAKFLVERLIQKFPNVDAKILVGNSDSGWNPKIQNLIKGYQAARFDVVLISDSNVCIESDYLSRLIFHLDEEGVGLVTSLVIADSSSSSLVGKLEALLMNTYYTKWMLIAAAFSKPLVLGKSMLFRRSVFERFGGIEKLSVYLAEDYMSGFAIDKLGMKVVVAQEPVRQTIGKWRWKDYWNRHLRWGRMRKVTAPLWFFAEPFSRAIPLSILGGLGLYAFNALSFWSAVFSLLFLQFSKDLFLMKLFDRRLNLKNLPLLWLIQEIVAVLLWIHTALGSSVLWRGEKYHLRQGGLLRDH